MQYLLWILTKISDNFSRIYVDVVINHMTERFPNARSVGGATADAINRQYPAVPYGPGDFNYPCPINNYNDPINVSNTDWLSFIFCRVR
jgi:alpha-amylase